MKIGKVERMKLWEVGVVLNRRTNDERFHRIADYKKLKSITNCKELRIVDSIHIQQVRQFLLVIYAFWMLKET